MGRKRQFDALAINGLAKDVEVGLVVEFGGHVFRRPVVLLDLGRREGSGVCCSTGISPIF